MSISVDPLNGFNNPVSVTIEGLPAGISVQTALPLEILPNQSRAIFLVASTAAPVGTTTVTVRGTSGTLAHTSAVSLTVMPRASFHLVLSSSSATLSRGTGTSAQVQYIVDSVAPSQAILSVASPLPNLGLSFGLTSVLLNPGESATLVIDTVAMGEALTDFPVVVTAQQGTDTAVATFRLTVAQPRLGHSGAGPGIRWHFDYASRQRL